MPKKDEAEGRKGRDTGTGQMPQAETNKPQSQSQASQTHSGKPQQAQGSAQKPPYSYTDWASI